MNESIGITDAFPEKTRRGCGGAKRKSGVWNYFVEDCDRKKSICQVKLLDGRICGKEICGKNTANLENHLKFIHPMHHSWVNKAKKERKEARQILVSSSTPSSTADRSPISRSSAVSFARLYNADHPKQIDFVRSLILYFAGTSAACETVEDPLFRDLIRSADPKLSLPTQQSISKAVRDLDYRMKSMVKAVLQRAITTTDHVLSLSIDIWSCSEWGGSFLSLTGHAFDKEINRRRSLLLAMIRLDDRYNLENIFSLVEVALGTYGLSINDQKVFHIVTDIGFGTKKAFAAIQRAPSADQAIDLTVPGVDRESLDADVRKQIDLVDSEILQYDRTETAHFVTFGFQKRLSCIDHNLAISVRNIINRNPDVILLKTVAFDLIRTINSSPVAEDFLLKRCGTKLVLPSIDCWMYTYHMLQRLLILRQGITALATQYEMVQQRLLSAIQWQRIGNLTYLLEPIATLISELEREQCVTISKVLPALLDIKAFLDEEDQLGDFVVLARDLKRDIRNRFSRILEPNDVNFQPIYATATLLDQKFTKILDLPECIELKAAGAAYLKRLTAAVSSTGPGQGQPVNDNENGRHQQSDPSDMLFSRLFSRIEKTATVCDIGLGRSDLEIDRYLRSRGSMGDETAARNPLEFWTSMATTFPNLYKTAIDILCVPATSAATKRLFSQAGLRESALSACFSEENLETAVMLRMNQQLLL